MKLLKNLKIWLIQIQKLNIQKKITPKQGRVVLFDGLLYHTAEQPNEDIRCIVNYDLVDLSVDSHI